MKLNRTDLRNLAMVELAVAAPQLFIRKQGKSTKVAFMDYQTAIPFKGKRPGTSFVLLPNVRSGRAVYATSGASSISSAFIDPADARMLKACYFDTMLNLELPGCWDRLSQMQKSDWAVSIWYKLFGIPDPKPFKEPAIDKPILTTPAATQVASRGPAGIKSGASRAPAANNAASRAAAASLLGVRSAIQKPTCSRFVNIQLAASRPTGGFKAAAAPPAAPVASKPSFAANNAAASAGHAAAPAAATKPDIAAAALRLGSIAGFAARTARQAGAPRRVSGAGSKGSNSKSADLKDCNDNNNNNDNNDSLGMRKEARSERKETQTDVAALLNNIGQQLIAAAEAAVSRAEAAVTGAQAAADATAAMQEDVRGRAAAAKSCMRKALAASCTATAAAAAAGKAEAAASRHANAAANSARDARCGARDVTRFVQEV